MPKQFSFVKAYILMDCKPRMAQRILQELERIDGVVSADSLWGRYEIIAIVQVKDLNELEEVVCDRVKALDGVVNTMTQIAKGRRS